MRVGIFLLLSAVAHLAIGQWLDWRPPMTPASPGAEQARVLALPAVVRIAPTQPLNEPEVEPVARAETPPAPVAAEPVAPAKPAPSAESQLITDKPEFAAGAETQPQPAASAAPRVSPQLQELSLPAEPVEVVSQAPRFREPPAAPDYPVQARRRNQQGQVLLEVRLDTAGKQRELRLLQSSGFSSLDQAALDAVADWKFEPEVQAGQAMPSRVQIPIDFALNTRR